MASSSQTLALFLIFHLLFSPALSDPATQQRIDGICRQMEDYGFCNKTFNDNLSGPADYVVLTRVANGQALKIASNTLRLIVQLIVGTTDPATKTALEDCRVGYSVVGQAFQQATFYFKQGDYRNMVDVERAAPRAQAHCRPTPNSPLIENNREMRILIAMAAVTGHHLA